MSVRKVHLIATYYGNGGGEARKYIIGVACKRKFFAGPDDTVKMHKVTCELCKRRGLRW